MPTPSLFYWTILQTASESGDVYSGFVEAIMSALAMVFSAIIQGLGAIVTGIINAFWTPIDLMAQAWQDSYQYFTSLGWASPLALTATAVVWGIVLAIGLFAIYWMINKFMDWLE